MIAAISNGKGIIEPLEPIVKSVPAQQPAQVPRPGSKVPGINIKTNIKSATSSNQYGKQDFKNLEMYKDDRLYFFKENFSYQFLNKTRF